MATAQTAISPPLAVGGRFRATTRSRAGQLARSKPLGAASLVMIALIVFVAIFAPWLAPYDPTEQTTAMLRGPSAEHVFGTDNFGRDILSQIIHGARISLQVGIAAVSIGTLVGAALGIVCGYLGGKLDLIVQRVMDAWMAFPGILLALAIMSVLGPGLVQTIIAVAITSVPQTNRIIRGAVLSIKGFDYIEAARTMGAMSGRIMFRHVLPNTIAPLIVITTLALGRAILAEASLSFLGLGVPAPTPAWGRMLAGESRSYMMVAPWMMIWPGMAISLTVLSWNLLGDALRDVLDPRLRGR
jgi:peptide/nickel transport system permease protein